MFAWDPNINFVLKSRSMEKAIGEMMKALICHVRTAVTPTV